MNDIANKDPVKRVRTALNLFDKNLKIQILENSARTALDASKALDCEVGAIVKSLVLRRKNSFLICLVSGDKKCSLNKLKKLPLDTKVYSGHEYAIKNLEFALSIDKDNEVLQNKYISVKNLVGKSLPSVPSTIKDELETNPFLRANNFEDWKSI